MSGLHIIKSASDQQDVVNDSCIELVSKHSPSEEIKTIRKCLRKGSRICYTDLENITVLKKIPEKKTSKISFHEASENEAFDKIDSYRSGESLFKTFTFEQTRDIDDPETRKCIEFWKSVMQKNLAPIKCTLLESDKKKAEKKQKKSSVSSEHKQQRPNLPNQDATTAPTFDIHPEKIWSDALKEIKRKKLDQLKLYTRERCAYCKDPFTKDLTKELGIESKEKQLKEIAALNDWKGSDQTSMDVSRSMRRRFSGKVKKISTSLGNGSRARDEKSCYSDQKDPSICLSKTRNSISVKRRFSNRKHSIDSDDSPTRISGIRAASVEIQAPTIKCPCESDNCICPHRAAVKNSRSNFIEIVRKNMMVGDVSSENLSMAEHGCLCTKPSRPWSKISCVSEPCPAKNPNAVQLKESSSDFNIDYRFGKDSDICVCKREMAVICHSDDCPNKGSQGSLIEGIPKIDKKDPCVCITSETKVPCGNEICPIKIKENVDVTCKCNKNLAWSQAICHSWRCPYNNKLYRRKPKDMEEKWVFRGHPPIQEDSSSCKCALPHPWTHITCPREQCSGKPKIETIARGADKKSISKPSSRVKATSKDILWKKDKNSKDKIPLSSKDLIAASREKLKQKLFSQPKQGECVCMTSPPWKTVRCLSESCISKETHGLQKEKPITESQEEGRPSSNDNECVCSDKTLEPICKAYKCKNREDFVEYPPPCLCPKNQDETQHQHFRCTSEKCKMKRIDQTCICPAQEDAVCDSRTCETKPQPLKTLKRVVKPLKYDSKCICKVRGVATTEVVSCTAPECPFKIKHMKPKKQAPKLVISPPPNLPSACNEPVTKCICNTKDLSITVTCPSFTCRKKNKSYRSEHSGEDDEDNSESEICVCKNIETSDSGNEVICRQVQCNKTAVGEGGAVMTDKCICANLDSPCDEPLCPQYSDRLSCKEDMLKKERPYCYICGHYDCASTKKKSGEICKDQSTTNTSLEYNLIVEHL